MCVIFFIINIIIIYIYIYAYACIYIIYVIKKIYIF